MWKGMFVLAAAGASIGLHVWFSSGVLFGVPQSASATAEYVFISSSFRALAVLTCAVWASIAILHTAIRRATRRHGERARLLSVEDTAYAQPLLVFAVSPVALLSIVPGLGTALTVWSFVVVDLRWWWTPLVLCWTLMRVDQRLQGSIRRAASRLFYGMMASKWASETALVMLAITWVVAGTSHLRFSGVTAGDEAKYLRFCELLYQGQGFELSNIKPIAQLPADYRPSIAHNFTLMARVLPGELRSLVSDVGIFIKDPSHQFNIAGRAQRRFFRGKNGGVYQVHSPGVSFLMFPAYVVDRQLGGPGRRPDSQWPERLFAVNGFFLALYGLWVVLLFRFLRRVTESASAAWLTTVALTLTMPVATFPFQFYPELAAGFIVVWVAGHVLFTGSGNVVTSVFAGLLAGYLPWLHVRFSALAMVLTVTGCLLLRRFPRRAVAFVIASLAAIGTSALYAYHLTGSVLPWSMWQEESGRSVLTLSRAFVGSFGYLLDRDWGLLPHAPVYLLALPGYALLTKRRPDVAWLCAATFLSLLLPAAAHTLTAAGATPMRLIVAVVPFAAVPMAELLARRGDAPIVRIAFALLLLLSLHTALAYNQHHYKSYGPLVDWSFSGWNTHLLFPSDTRSAWTNPASNLWLLLSWLLTLILLPAYTAVRAVSHASRPSFSRAAGIAVAGLLVAGTAICAATGEWKEQRFQLPTRTAVQRASTLLDSVGQCSVCVSSTRGRLDTARTRSLLSNLAPPRKQRIRPPTTVEEEDPGSL